MDIPWTHLLSPKLWTSTFKINNENSKCYNVIIILSTWGSLLHYILCFMFCLRKTHDEKYFKEI